MSLRERLGQTSKEADGTRTFEIFGVADNPFPAAGQSTGHPRMEDDIDDEFEARVRKYQSAEHPSQIVLLEGTQGVGKTNLLIYYEQQFHELYDGSEDSYIIRYYPDPEPSFDAVVRKIIQGLDHDHFVKIGRALAQATNDARDSAKDIARSHDVRLVLNSLEKAGAESECLNDCARLALEWFGGLRVLNRHREKLGVSFRLDTVESRTQALRDVVYVSERLGLLKGVVLLLDELEKQDYSLSKTPVLRFLSAIRALIDSLPRNLFLVLAMTPQARLRYFAMMPALAGRLQDVVKLGTLGNFEQAKGLCEFYIEVARDRACAMESMKGMEPGSRPIFGEVELKQLFEEVGRRSSELGTEGITPRDFLHRLHEKWGEVAAAK